ncbi:hydantoinase B/oxoprolinase family protein [Rhodococcus sp. 2H158]
MTANTVETPQGTVPWDGRQRGYIPSNPPVIHPAITLHTSAQTDVDPVTAEVVRYALMNINLEHADLIQRLAVSPVVMLSRDFQSSILTEVGELVYLGSGVQYYSNFHSLIVKYILEHHQAETLADGDMLLCNDPYIGCAHQCDTSLVAPIFVDGELFCWIANSMHFQDLGGTVPGSLCVSAEDCWQESAIWTPISLVERGRVRTDVEDLFVRQSRFPDVTRMDLRAAYGSLETTRKKIVALVERYGAAVVKGIMNRVLDAGEELFVERLARIPDGRWSYRASMEGSVPGDHEFYRYQINVTKQGDRLIVDNEGSDPQVGAINVTYAGMSGCVLASFTSQMLPEMAGAFGGAYRRIEFRPTPGTVSCADHPAAVSASAVFTQMHVLNVAATPVCMMLAAGDDETRDLILGAPTPNLSSVLAGGVRDDGKPFMLMDSNGLMGSLAGRASRDGVDVGGQWWIPDSIAYNSEEMEAQTPFLVLSRVLLPVAGDGAGRCRAGVGMRETLMAHGIAGGALVVHQNENVPRAAGLFGGNPGSLATCRFKRNNDALEQLASGALPVSIEDIHGDEVELEFKGGPETLANGDVIEWVSPGAAGYGDPLLRDPQDVQKDLDARLITEEAAAAVYGVVFADGVVDSEATARARAAVRRERLGGVEAGECVEPPAGARRIGELLYIVNGRWWCNGADLGDQYENYKDRAVTRVVPVRKIAAEFEVANHEIADRWEFREAICPVTGFRIDAELAMVGEPSLHDVIPAGA